MAAITLSITPLLCNYKRSHSHLQLPSSLSISILHPRRKLLRNSLPFRCQPCFATPNSSNNNKSKSKSKLGVGVVAQNEETTTRRILKQAVLWGMEAVYILWLFFLPFAPGDPVWAISTDTINSLVGLSLNFFFILPISNSVGIHALEAPVLHPMSEGLFNFVVAWTFMFAPLLYTDFKNGRYKGSLDVLWGLQMFLTNSGSKCL